MHAIGLDLGSVYVKAVCLESDGEVAATLYRRRDENDLPALQGFLGSLACDPATQWFHLGFTGVEEQKAQTGQATWTNSLLAVAAGIRRLHPQVRSIVEVGGQTAKYLVLDEAGGLRDFATNEACAAGTGSFLEQQARRLGLSAESLSHVASDAQRGATIAGRCSVFANSDMIHLQQKGTPLPEIAYGLCLAIARNFLTTLLKGRDVAPPLLLAGGCAFNAGILRAFREVMDHGEPLELQTSAHPGLEGAIGAACLAQHGGSASLSLEQVSWVISQLLSASRGTQARLPVLPQHPQAPPSEEPLGAPGLATEGFLGLDVGSVSTDLVLLDAAGDLLASIYLPTRGRPAEVLLEGLATLEQRMGGVFRVLGCGATGSGRHLAAKLAGADVVKNEITCQLLGAQHYVPDVDTVLEIGGQDSKFIRVAHGGVADFAMNKVCAAGTGSFLEEQAAALGVDIRNDFAARALAAGPSPDLGSRCTVFMETEVVGARASGIGLEPICAGLAFSIVRNYLDKVVGTRPIGQRIVFQGGVASNGAVVAAFEAVLQRPIQVHPYNRISGAIGAALAARNAFSREQTPSRFKGFRRVQAPTLRAFECRHCANHCDVNVIEMGGERSYFGDTCERYTSGPHTTSTTLPNLAEEFLEQCEALYGGPHDPGPRIGIPRASSLMGDLPFWALFWKELGFGPVLSEPSSQATLAQGLHHLSVGVCLPIKLTAGHVHNLLAAGLECVFLPSLVLFPGEDPERSYACPYTTAAPYMVDAASEGRILAPVIRFTGEVDFAAGFEPYLNRLHITREQVLHAFRAATWAQAQVVNRFTRRAKMLVEGGQFKHLFAILGRPYGLFDAYVNLGLFERLRRMEVLALPLPFLPLDDAPAEPGSTLPWRFPADMHRTASALANPSSFHPVILSSFGCGPDAFALPQIERSLRDRSHLVLETDEHRGEAGLITRLEAFLDELEDRTPRLDPHPGIGSPSTAVVPLEPSRIRIPYISDCAYAFSGLFQFKGHDAQVLAPPDESSRALGEQHALGKECHAYTMVVGDLLRLAQEEPDPETIFFFPGTALPCLLHEYGAAMQALIEDCGIKGLRVCSPHGEQLLSAVGFRGIERFYVGLLAIEILVKALCQVRPYEWVKGSADGVHRQNLLRMEAAMAGGDILEALEKSLEMLSLVPKQEERNRPLVGLAGDLYTRVNPAANLDLAHWLEARGLEVWPSPFQIDLLDFGISRRLQLSLGNLDLPGILQHGPVALRRALHQWRVKNVVGSQVSRYGEPDYEEMKQLAAPYMPNEAHELLFLNIAKIVDFAENGTDGIINAICFGCMVGNASAAVIERIRKTYQDLPIITAVYAGGEDPSRRMVLEAFVSQVKARHQRQRGRRLSPAVASPSPSLV